MQAGVSRGARTWARGRPLLGRFEQPPPLSPDTRPQKGCTPAKTRKKRRGSGAQRTCRGCVERTVVRGQRQCGHAAVTRRARVEARHGGRGEQCPAPFDIIGPESVHEVLVRGRCIRSRPLRVLVENLHRRAHRPRWRRSARRARRGGGGHLALSTRASTDHVPRTVKIPGREGQWARCYG